MFFKVIHNKEVHIFNPKGPATLLGLKVYIKSAFKAVPQKYHLEYEDIENDLVTLASEDDFQMMVETSSKIVKIFVRQTDQDFYDQTAHVLLDDEILSVSRKNSEIAESEKEFVNMVEEPKAQEKPEPVQMPKEQADVLESIPSSLNESNVSAMSQVTEAEIDRKLQQMLPELIGKVKEEIFKESMTASSIKQKSEIKPQKQQVKEEKVIHRYYICDECGINGIEGIRYKCAVCPDFDLCEKCEVTSTHDHPFLKIKHPRHTPLKVYAVMRQDHQNSFEINGQSVPLGQIPFFSDIYEAFFGKRQQGQQQQGFKVPEFLKGYCPFKKGQKKCEQKPAKEEKKVQEKPVEEKLAPKVEEKRVQEKKVESEGQTESKRVMANASYLNQILDIDYNRCYKFALKNPKLTQEELLDLYFENTNFLV